MLSELVTLKEQNKKILQVLNERFSVQSPQNIELPVEIPLESEDGLEALEEFLNEKQNFCAFVSKKNSWILFF